MIKFSTSEIIDFNLYIDDPFNPFGFVEIFYPREVSTHTKNGGNHVLRLSQIFR